MNLKQKIAVAVMDVAILVEMCVAIYMGNEDPENMTAIFMKVFFSMLIPTLIIARIAVKRLRTKEPEQES